MSPAAWRRRKISPPPRGGVRGGGGGVVTLAPSPQSLQQEHTGYGPRGIAWTQKSPLPLGEGLGEGVAAS